MGWLSRCCPSGAERRKPPSVWGWPVTTPVFRRVANGEDATAAIADRLVEITVVDGCGDEADTAQLVVDDRDGVVERPARGATLGTRQGGLVPMGQFIVDITASVGPLRQMRITKTAAGMAGPIRAPRTVAWEGMSLGALVDSIAGLYDLGPMVDRTLGAISLPCVAQTSENDLHLLTRLGALNSFIVAPKAGRLIVAQRDVGSCPTAPQLLRYKWIGLILRDGK